jgi:hypothetical protein
VGKFESKWLCQWLTGVVAASDTRRPFFKNRKLFNRRGRHIGMPTFEFLWANHILRADGVYIPVAEKGKEMK